MFLMNDFLLCLMDNGNVLLMNVFLVNDWLDVFVDNRFVMFMDNILVEFVDNILMMFMDYFSV